MKICEFATTDDCRFFFVLSLIFFLTLFNAPSLQAQDNTAAINGYVRDATTGETLLGANVIIQLLNKGASTNTAGYYTIQNLEPGTYEGSCTYIGYKTYREEISLEAGESRRLDIEMEPQSQELGELVVQSEREEREKRSIGRAEIQTDMIQQMPSVLQSDVFRSAQLLPGVKAASDFSSRLYIRGGSSDQTLILLDQTKVYNPSHFFGFFSTFNPDAIKNVRLYKGGYPAKYGGRLGSVLAIYNKDGNRNNYHTGIQVGMLSSSIIHEGPYKHGSYMIAFRRSTLEPLLAGLRQTQDGIPNKFYFWDLNGKINLSASQDDKLSLSFYSGTDNVGIPFADDAQINLFYGNQTVSANWTRIITDNLFADLTVTGSRYFNEPTISIGGTGIRQDNEIYDLSVKGDLEYFYGDHEIDGGFWSGYMNFNYKDYFDGEQTFSQLLKSYYNQAYIQDRWQPNERWEVNGGLRLSHFSEGNYLRLAPRLSVDYQWLSNVRLQAAYGRYYQYLTLVTNEAFSGFDYWLTSDEGVPPSWGDQFILGAKTQPFEGYQLDGEIYYRTMHDLFQQDPFINNLAGKDYREIFRFGDGYAYGAEVQFQKQVGRLTGFLAYTFARTMRKFPGYNHSIENPGKARYYPPKYDRTHDVTMTLSYRLTDNWELSTVFNYATGQAYTRPLGYTETGGFPFGEDRRGQLLVGKVNAARLPPYHRVDLSATRDGTFFGMGSAEWKFQIINVYSRRNMWFYNYDLDERPIERSAVKLLPILPSVTYSVDF